MGRLGKCELRIAKEKRLFASGYGESIDFTLQLSFASSFYHPLSYLASHQQRYYNIISITRHRHTGQLYNLMLIVIDCNVVVFVLSPFILSQQSESKRIKTAI